MEAVGLRRGLIEKKSFPKLSADVPTLDFSGWPIYTLASTPDGLVRDFCRALEESKALIPWAKAEPLPMAQMVRDSAEGHLEVPLHRRGGGVSGASWAIYPESASSPRA